MITYSRAYVLGWRDFVRDHPCSKRYCQCSTSFIFHCPNHQLFVLIKNGQTNLCMVSDIPLVVFQLTTEFDHSTGHIWLLKVNWDKLTTIKWWKDEKKNNDISHNSRFLLFLLLEIVREPMIRYFFYFFFCAPIVFQYSFVVFLNFSFRSLFFSLILHIVFLYSQLRFLFFVTSFLFVNHLHKKKVHSNTRNREDQD